MKDELRFFKLLILSSNPSRLTLSSITRLRLYPIDRTNYDILCPSNGSSLLSRFDDAALLSQSVWVLDTEAHGLKTIMTWLRIERYCDSID